jgi:hypothetical protein
MSPAATVGSECTYLHAHAVHSDQVLLQVATTGANSLYCFRYTLSVTAPGAGGMSLLV